MFSILVVGEHAYVPAGHAYEVGSGRVTDTKGSPPRLPQIVTPSMLVCVIGPISGVLLLTGHDS